MSYTGKVLVRAQNLVERSLLAEGDVKHIGTMPDHIDAWGTPVRVEMVEMGDYLYMVRSAGPDKKYLTSDDPIIGGLKPMGFKSEPDGGLKAGGSSASGGVSGSAKAQKTDTTLKSLLKTSAGGFPESPGTGGALAGSDPGGDEADGEEMPREEVVELEELIEKTE